MDEEEGVGVVEPVDEEGAAGGGRGARNWLDVQVDGSRITEAEAASVRVEDREVCERQLAPRVGCRAG